MLGGYFRVPIEKELRFAQRNKRDTGLYGEFGWRRKAVWRLRIFFGGPFQIFTNTVVPPARGAWT
jgi:hypothetical protein